MDDEETCDLRVNDPRDSKQAGFKSAAAEYIGQVLSLDQRFVRNRPATYFWWVRGDESRILGLRDGDLLIVDRSLEPAHGDLVVCVIGGEFRIRRLRRWGQILVPAPLRRSEETDPFEKAEVWGVIRVFARELKHGHRPRGR